MARGDEEAVARLVDNRFDVPFAKIGRAVADIENLLRLTRQERWVTRITSRAAQRLLQRRGGDRSQLDGYAMQLVHLTGLVDFLQASSLAECGAELTWFMNAAIASNGQLHLAMWGECDRLNALVAIALFDVVDWNASREFGRQLAAINGADHPALSNCGRLVLAPAHGGPVVHLHASLRTMAPNGSQDALFKCLLACVRWGATAPRPVFLMDAKPLIASTIVHAMRADSTVVDAVRYVLEHAYWFGDNDKSDVLEQVMEQQAGEIEPHVELILRQLGFNKADE